MDILGCKNIISNAIPSLLYKREQPNYTKQEYYIPAIMLAYHTKTYFNGQRYNGYLPAIGQLMFMTANISKINSALNAICEYEFIMATNLDDVCMFNWWSSTENYFANTWHLRGVWAHSIGKTIDCLNVLPLFAL